MNSLYLEVPLPLDGFPFSFPRLGLWRNSDCFKICPDSSTLCDEDKNYMGKWENGMGKWDLPAR